MSDTAIIAEGVSKLYRIGLAERRHESLVGAAAATLTAPLRNLRRLRRLDTSGDGGEADDTIWALRDVSFEVKRGEVVGIIGRNGAGKSTLLKILSRITEPTRGRIRLRGRVASLLEVGTGFHPDLTGRENVYLNGTILGMTKREIDRKFDEIVAFSEVEKFLDTPVKRYSSGMRVRLAFAVAAHLEPEILVVDEVLAVGDANFQKKCLGKMQEVGSQGRTILFVSHSSAMILRLCDRVVRMEGGRVAADGAPAAVVRDYLASGPAGSCERAWADPAGAPGDAVAQLRAVRVLDDRREVAEVVEITRDCFIEIEYWSNAARPRATAAFHLINESGVVLFASADFQGPAWHAHERRIGPVRSRCRIPGNFLAEGRFTVLAALVSYNPTVVHAVEPDAVSFQVVDRSDGQGVRGSYAGDAWPGVVRPMLDWE